MSADNWTICPKCKIKNDKANEKHILDTAAKYGKIPVEEYIQLAKETEMPIILKPTLREDYEIGMAEKGFYVSYSCQCTECGFSFSYERKIGVEL